MEGHMVGLPAHHGTPIYLPSLSWLPSLGRGDRQTDGRSVGTRRSQAHPHTLWGTKREVLPLLGCNRYSKYT